MAAWSVTRGTILNHINNYVRADHPLPVARILAESTWTAEEQERVLALFDEHGSALLRPTLETLGGTINWDELRLLQAVHYLREKENR